MSGAAITFQPQSIQVRLLSPNAEHNTHTHRYTGPEHCSSPILCTLHTHTHTHLVQVVTLATQLSLLQGHMTMSGLWYGVFQANPLIMLTAGSTIPVIEARRAWQPLGPETALQLINKLHNTWGLLDRLSFFKSVNEKKVTNNEVSDLKDSETDLQEHPDSLASWDW